MDKFMVFGGFAIAALIFVLLFAISGALVPPGTAGNCDTTSDCSSTISIYGMTVGDPVCSSTGSCEYRTCVSGCTEQYCDFYSLDCPEIEGKCGDGKCDSNENKQNCPKDCGTECNPGATKDCQCGGMDDIVCYVCRDSGIWTTSREHIKYCSLNTVCKSGTCVVEEPDDTPCTDGKIQAGSLRCDGDDWSVYKYCHYGTWMDMSSYIGCGKGGKICKSDGDSVWCAVKQSEIPINPDNPEEDWCANKNDGQLCLDKQYLITCKDGKTVDKDDCTDMIGYFGEKTSGTCVTNIMGESKCIPPTSAGTPPGTGTGGTGGTGGVGEQPEDTIKCTADSYCNSLYKDCFAYCGNDGYCHRNPLEPQKIVDKMDGLCEGAKWLPYPECKPDVSACKEEEKKCGDNEYLSDDDKCECKEGFTRIGLDCVDIATLGTYATGGVVLIGAMIAIVFVLVILIMIFSSRGGGQK